MENKVLNKNLDHIASYNKSLVNEILMSDLKKSNIGIIKTEKDEYNLVYNDNIIHDQNGAIEEAQRIAQKFIDNESSIKVIYGLGLGYLADAFCEKIKKSKIIIYEPNIDILNFVFSIAQIDAIYQNNVFVCSDKNDYMALLEKFITDNQDVTITFLSSYKKMFYDDIVNLFNITQKVQGEVIGNKNTYINKAPDAVGNTIYNLNSILNNPDISALKDIYKGKTALIAGAGPTLKENIEIIKENKDKFVIFALNQSLKLLTYNNITPDFIVDIESINNYAQFENIDISNSYLILEPFVYHKIHKLKAKKIFNYISANNFINPFILDLLGINNDLQTLGTVSYTAFLSAVLMGFNKIVLIGQDLSYKNGQLYSKGSQFDNLKCIFDEKTKKYVIEPENYENFINSIKTPAIDYDLAKKEAKKYLQELNQNIATVNSQQGTVLPAQRCYAYFIDIFQNSAKKIKKQNKNIQLINSSTGSAQIDGFENIPIEKVASELTKIDKIDLSKYCANNKNLADKLLKIINQLNKFKLAMEELEKSMKMYCAYWGYHKKYEPGVERMHNECKDALIKVVEFKKDETIKDIITPLVYSIEQILKDHNNKENYQEVIDTLLLAYKKIETFMPLLEQGIDNLTNG